MFTKSEQPRERIIGEEIAIFYSSCILGVTPKMRRRSSGLCSNVFRQVKMETGLIFFSCLCRQLEEEGEEETALEPHIMSIQAAGTWRYLAFGRVFVLCVRE